MHKPEKKSLSQQVYEHLAEKLYSGKLVPGDLLNRRDVANQLGMSPAPVLEAMLQLQQEGFLEAIPRKGTRVRPVKPADLRGQLLLRTALETQIARMICGKPVKQSEDRLMKLAQRADAAAPNTVDMSRAEINFHRALGELTRTPALLDALDRNLRLGMFLAIQILTRGSRSDSHVGLLRKLKTSDKDRAEKAMRRHLVLHRNELLGLEEPENESIKD